MVCIFQVVGRKDTGKTSVIEKVLEKIKKERKLKVAVVKHSHHKLDLSGKDTDRYRNMHSDYILFQEGDFESVLFMPYVSSLVLLHLLPVDLIIIEGFSNMEIGKRYYINSVDEADKIAEKIVEDAKECQKVKVNLYVDGKIIEANSDNPLFLTLYNLMSILKVKNVSSG
ncbi:MAG: molybdopterin-guanine dinucleotide biosynthesis protein B [Saccharolobus sp.]